MRTKITLESAIFFLGQVKSHFLENARLKREIGEKQICPEKFELQAKRHESDAEMCGWVVEFLEELLEFRNQANCKSRKGNARNDSKASLH